MMPRYVLDTSVAVKWFSLAGEDNLPQALKIRQDFLEGRVQLLVPELFFVELANALRYNTHFNAQDTESAVRSVWSMELERGDLSSEVLKEAIRLAYQHQITLYDALFLALARTSDSVLVTADEMLCRKVTEPSHILSLKHVP